MPQYVDIARRAYDHNWKLDPIVRSLLDTDFYKLLMLAMIHRLHPRTRATFSLINRSRSIRLADDIDIDELRAQLDHARTLRFTKNELIWLAGNTFYGRKQIFDPDFIEWLSGFSLPEYELRAVDGQFELRFQGLWQETTLWEIPALSIVNELRSRAALKEMSRFEIDVLYARAKSKLWDKVVRLRTLAAEGPLRIADFGTRRRHGYLWQLGCVEMLKEGLGDCFTGTSNVKMAMDVGIEAIGTNAHELPMVYAALSDSDEELLQSPYRVMRDWATMYDGNLKVILPDAFGTTSFLHNAPDWVAEWSGARPDSKPPVEGSEEFIAYWKAHGQDPKDKLMILSDGMDIDTIERSVRSLRDQVKISIGWGTNLTNDFAGCAANGAGGKLASMSLVCKVTEANGRPAVKLSDNVVKATGPKQEIERYMRVFGHAGMGRQEVKV